MTDDVATKPAGELATMIRDRAISSRELLQLYLDRIEARNSAINAVVALDVERAFEACAMADAATAADESFGLLHGLPITIKDAIETEGIRSTGGAIELKDHVPTADAPAVARLKTAGAIVFGKTNAPRWSGDVQTYSELFGTTNNPWDLTRTPGGSSGGAAAAVACGLTSFELGTDIGGSVRIPSHFCGVFGLKPSFGIVSQRGYLDHVGGGTTDADINVFGPIARDASDLDLLLSVLAGPDADRAVAWRLELPPPRFRSITDYRVVAWFDAPGLPLDAEYRDILAGAADAIAAAGAKVDDTPPPIDFGMQVGLFHRMVSAASSIGSDAPGPSHAQWLEDEKRRSALRAAWASWFKSVDLLLSPVTPTPAIEHQHAGGWLDRTIMVNGETRPYLDNISWTGLSGVIGLPSVVAPIGRTRDGLPVGVQIVAPYLRDRDAIQAAALIAELLGGYTAP